MSTPSQSKEPTTKGGQWSQQTGLLFSPLITEMTRISNLIPAYDKGLRIGFYNSISLISILIVSIVIYNCYWVLKPFLQPLVWAILCGSALHSFKRKLLVCSGKWISDLKSDGQPMILASLLLPLVMVKYFTDWMIDFLFKYWKVILVILVPMGLNSALGHYWMGYFEKSYTVMMTIINVVTRFTSLLSHSDNTFIIISLTVGYLMALAFCWTKTTEKFLTFVSPFVWISLSVNFIYRFGTFGHVIAVILASIVLIGLVQSLFGHPSGIDSSDQTDGSSISSLKDYLKTKANYILNIFIQSKEQSAGSDIENEEQDEPSSQGTSVTDGSASNTQLKPNVSFSRRSSLRSNANEDGSTSNRYLYAVLLAILLVQLHSYFKFTLLLTIPIALKLILLFIYKYILPMISNNIHRFKTFAEKRSKALFHPLVRHFFNYFLIGDRVICLTIESSLSGLTSLSVITITIVSFLFIGVFISIQIYGESIHLINSVSNVLNETIRSYPESGILLPQGLTGIDELLDQMVRNGYEYGREYIKSFVKNAFQVNDNKTRAVEKQVLEIWDRAYHMWLIRNSDETQTLPKKGPYDFHKLYNAFTTLDVSLCFNIVKENIDTLLSVLDSVWLVLKGNISLLFSATTAVLSILLGGGLGLMNLGLSFVIFTTALFYLLSASGEHYKPVELVNRLFPTESIGQSSRNSSITSKFGRAVEEAVNGVFAASLKMSAFYGLYTYLIHILFDVNIVYIPSVMAAILGAVPFLSAFWASFPASLELFFAHKQRTKAILLLVSAYFPSLFVDSTIYGEIKSAGHPYLTGLAIAGGVFYLGFEGAIFGPMLLCFLFVAFNMYTSIMEESPVKGDSKPSRLSRMQSCI